MDLEDGYKVLYANNTKTLPLEGATSTLTYFAESVNTTTVDGKTTKTVTPAYYLYFDGTYYYMGIVTDSSVANAKLVAGNKVVDFLYMNENLPVVDANGAATYATTYKTSDVAVKVGTAKVTGAKCGEFSSATADHDVYEIDNAYYQLDDGTAVAGIKTALLNGKVCAFVSSDATVVGHDFDLTKTNAKDGVYTSVYCKTEKAYVAVIKASSVPATDVSDYNVVGAGDFADYVYLKIAAPTASTGSTTTVESAKTFDAGIALYAGMALASVAGSAVVIGKKKEF